MTPPQEDHYQVLGVDCNASDSDLTKAYKKLALKYHPDKSDQQDNSSGETFKRITEAYNVLHDPEQRKCYDDQRDARAFHQGSKGFELHEFCDLMTRQPRKESHAFRSTLVTDSPNGTSPAHYAPSTALSRIIRQWCFTVFRSPYTTTAVKPESVASMREQAGTTW